VWVARKVAARTRLLSAERVAGVDRRTAQLVGRVAVGRLLRRVDAEVMAADPAGAQTRAAAARREQGVWLSREADRGDATLAGKEPAVDLDGLEASTDHLANAVAVLGDGANRDLLRAKALTLLGNPAAVLETIAAAKDRLDHHDAGQDVPRRTVGDLGTATM